MQAMHLYKLPAMPDQDEGVIAGRPIASLAFKADGSLLAVASGHKVRPCCQCLHRTLHLHEVSDAELHAAARCGNLP